MRLDLNNFSYLNRKRCDEVYWPLVDCDLATLKDKINDEMHELHVEIYNCQVWDGCGEEPCIALGKEIADVVTYLDLLAQRVGLNLSDILVQKFNEVSDRKKTNIKIPV